MATARARRLALDVPLGLATGWVLWVAAQWERWSGDPGPWRGDRPWDGPRADFGAVSFAPVPFALAMVAGVCVRRLWPRAGFAVVATAGVGYLLTGGQIGPAVVAASLCVYAMAAAVPVRRWVALTPLLPALVLAAGWDRPYLGASDPQTYANLIFAIAVTGVAALLALVRTSRRDAIRQRRADELERAAADERLRLAREVHDVVGHSLSVISMQAGVALHVLDRRPEQIRPALEAIRATSSEAMAELRHALGVFRSSEDSPTAPAPDLARVDGLVAALRVAGRSVDVHRSIPAGTPLPAAVQQTAFRIVQEALTNVVRHAEQATATVRLTVSDATLDVQVSDDGPLLTGPLREGNGLRGMRERVTALGGTLAVRARPTGGVEVHATLPTISAEVP